MDTSTNCSNKATSYEDLVRLNQVGIEHEITRVAGMPLPVMIANYGTQLKNVHGKLGQFGAGALLISPEMTEKMPPELHALLAATTEPNDKIDMRMVADNIRAIGTLSETLATAIEAGIESAPEPPPFEEFAAGAADEPCHCNHATTAEEAN